MDVTTGKCYAESRDGGVFEHATIPHHFPAVEARTVMADSQSIRRRPRYAWRRVKLTGGFPESGACYAFYLEGRLAYIGQTGNLKSRMHSHGVRVSAEGDWYITPWGDC